MALTKGAAHRLVALFALGLTAGCGLFQSESVKKCKAELSSELKSPSSIKIVEVHEIREQSTVLGAKEIIGDDVLKRLDKKWMDQKVVRVTVLIDYDAANSFGVMLRDSKICNLVEAEGELEWAITNAKSAAAKADMDEAVKAAQEALRDAEKALQGY